MAIEIVAVRHAGIDNAFFIDTGKEEWLATLSGRTEDAIEHEGQYYRPWSPATSKLSSMILKGMKVPLHRGSRVLYLGAASGTTVTHVSDIVTDGTVFAVEFAPRPARDLLRAVAGRANVVPIVADARSPEKYPPFIGSADFLFQDVAQPDQAAIAIANAEKYLVPAGHAAIAIKARSISVAGSVKEIFDQEIALLSQKLEIVKAVSLEPLHHDHMAVLCRY
jgi:fibrillarin-like pre-rRNA processing protein